MLRITVIYYFNYGYISIISGLSINITKIKNSIATYNFLKTALLILIYGYLILTVYYITFIRIDLIKLQIIY